jgi:hypothetical protein
MQPQHRSTPRSNQQVQAKAINAPRQPGAVAGEPLHRQQGEPERKAAKSRFSGRDQAVEALAAAVPQGRMLTKTPRRKSDADDLDRAITKRAKTLFAPMLAAGGAPSRWFD